MLIALIGNFTTHKESEVITKVFILFGVTLMIACVIVYSTRVKRKRLGITTKVGYSFYLAVSSIVLAAGAGVASLAKH